MITAELLQAFLDSAPAKKLAAARTTAQSAERARLVEERARLEGEAAENYRRHYDIELPDALAAVAKAQAELKAARERMNQLAIARTQASSRSGAALQRVDDELRSTADVAIEAFIRDMWTEFHAARAVSPIETQAETTNPNTGRKVRTSGRPVVQPADRMQAIREAIAAAENLKLAADQTGVALILAELRTALPTIGAARD